MKNIETVVEEVVNLLKKKNSSKVDELKKIKDSLEGINSQASDLLEVHEDLPSNQAQEYGNSVIQQTVKAAEDTIRIESEIGSMLDRSKSILSNLNYLASLYEAGVVDKIRFDEGICGLKSAIEQL